MNELLLRGVDRIIGEEELAEAVRSGRKLRIKFGVDLTRPDLHLGHAVPLRLLRQFQDQGHTIIFLIGDYTTKIGDPSGKSKTRPMLTDDEIAANVRTYLDQVGKLLVSGKAEIRYNSEWLGQLSFGDLISLASNVSVAQTIERDDFKNRLATGQELALHELLYPLMQAYDSVALKADVEFGGSDQLFNLMAGRALQKKLGQRPQIVITTELLVGTDGYKKMSKSLDNYIGLTEAPGQMYGKVMSLPDNLIAPYYKLCTDISLPVIDELVKTLAEGANPRDSKASLARELVRIYHGEDAALDAETNWNQTYRDRKGPTDDQIIDVQVSTLEQAEVVVTAGKAPLMGFLLAVEAASSRGNYRKLIEQGGIRLDGDKVTDPETTIAIGQVASVGKTNFFRFKK